MTTANNHRDKAFREWYDARIGTKSEGFAYDVWCAAWEASGNGFHTAIPSEKDTFADSTQIRENT